jgi:hypothetical protein
MTEDEPRTEPTTDGAATDAARPTDATRPPADTAVPKVPDEPLEPDKTDMSAVGDDGQVFGG